MKYYRKTSHSIYDIKYHSVRITEYRRPVLFGNAALRVRELIREICRAQDIEILKGHVSKDHVHLSVSVPPNISVSRAVHLIKGKTQRKLSSGNRKLPEQFWGRHLRARGYFAAASGNVTDDVTAQYIRSQDAAERARDDDFRIGS